MRRGELALLVATHLEARHVVVCSLGSTMFAWQAADSPVPTYYATDPMGLAPGLALGFALARPDRDVLLLEGDGDLLMNLGVLLTIADVAPRNLRIIVFHNGRYETGGAQPLPGPGKVRLASLAAAAGFDVALERDVDASVDEVHAALDELFGSPTPALLVVGVEPEAAPYGGAGSESGVEHRAAFQRRLEAEQPGSPTTRSAAPAAGTTSQ